MKPLLANNAMLGKKRGLALASFIKGKVEVPADWDADLAIRVSSDSAQLNSGKR